MNSPSVSAKPETATNNAIKAKSKRFFIIVLFLLVYNKIN
jgi:hypothetical protein